MLNLNNPKWETLTILKQILNKKRSCSILTVLLIISCNIESQKIKGLTPQLSIISDEIITNSEYKSSGNYLKKMRTKFPNLLKPIIAKYDLCSITNYENMGIVFVFSCKIDPENKSLFGSDPKYNLIKLTNPQDKTLLGYEQFVDYGSKPVELGNGWYYIEQNEFFD